MCIRDRVHLGGDVHLDHGLRAALDRLLREQWGAAHRSGGCLLYTSDAADERSSVDLGGRRIIKKKQQRSTAATTMKQKQTMKHHD